MTRTWWDSFQRLSDPAAVIWLMLIQALHTDTSIRSLFKAWVCVFVCEYIISVSEIICFPHYISRCFNIWAQLCCYSSAERFLFDSHSLGILGNHKPPEQPQMGQKNVPTARRLGHSDTLSLSSLCVFFLLVC